jgi:hypothetical protein
MTLPDDEDSWPTPMEAPAPLFDDPDAFFPAPEPPPPLPALPIAAPVAAPAVELPAQPHSGRAMPAPIQQHPSTPAQQPLTVVTADPWHAPWQGDCSPEMQVHIQEMLDSGVQLKQPVDKDDSKYPILGLKPFQSLVWLVHSAAGLKVLQNRVAVHVSRVSKRTGRHYVVLKHVYRDDYITLEVTRVPTQES